MMEKLNMQTESKVDKNIDAIGKMFPNTLTEVIKGYDENGKAIIEQAIDFDLLKQELSNVVIEGNEERYQMNWPDKKKSILLANSPIDKTLRPCKEESVDFDSTENLYIEGDNLDVLKLLRETYLNRVKMIYIDPPYNTGGDSFVYNDNFSMEGEDFSEASGQYDEKGNMLFDVRQNNESNGRFHTDWLNMMYPRLKLAKDLLTEDGVIFISINDVEIENLKKICNECFGEANFVHCLKWKRKKQPSFLHGHVASVVEYILIYSKEKIKLEKLSIETRSDGNTRVDNAANTISERNIKSGIRVKLPISVEKIEAGIYQSKTMSTEFLDDVFIKDGRVLNDFRVRAQFRNDQDNITKFCENDILFITVNYGFRRDLLEEELCKRKSIVDLILDWGDNQDSDIEIKELFGDEKPFSYPKPSKLIYNLIKSLDSNDFIVLDFFAGSSTTAQSVMKLNLDDGGYRKFIMVQLPENLDSNIEKANKNEKQIIENAIRLCDKLNKTHMLTEIGKERIRRAGAKIKQENPDNADNLDSGFRVLKLDSTNMKEVFYKPAQFVQSALDGFEENIKEDRSAEDLLFQVMLELGELLSSDIEEMTIADKKVFNVGGGNIIACFDTKITNEVVTEIAKLKPMYAVFRDNCMDSDSVATNFEEIFKTYSPNTTRKVL